MPHGRPVPYLPFADVIRQLCGISEADTAQGLVDKVRRGIAALGLDPRERTPFALAVLGATPGPEALAPATVTARIAETVRQLLVAASWQRPLAVAIEDLHWSDPDSEELLGTLAGALAAAPLLLIATYRPGRPVPWPAAAAAEIALEPLSSEDARAVLRSALGADPIPDALADLVLERAEGNPLFVEELTRAVVEHPDLPTARTAPATVQDVLLSRIHRLPEEDRRLLQCAAVIGKDRVCHAGARRAARPPPARHRGHRGRLSRPARRASRPPRPPCRARRGVGQGDGLSPRDCGPDCPGYG